MDVLRCAPEGGAAEVARFAETLGARAEPVLVQLECSGRDGRFCYRQLVMGRVASVTTDDGQGWIEFSRTSLAIEFCNDHDWCPMPIRYIGIGESPGGGYCRAVTCAVTPAAIRAALDELDLGFAADGQPHHLRLTAWLLSPRGRSAGETALGALQMAVHAGAGAVQGAAVLLGCSERRPCGTPAVFA